MFKKLFLPLCLCLGLLCGVPAGAAANDLTVYQNGTLNFAEHTAGAEAALDGNAATAYEGSVTGRFASRSVLTGITVMAGSKITDLTVSGSQDGVHWVRLYSRERVNTVCMFGYNGVTYDEVGMNEMYTYALQYLRIEIAYGSISDIRLRGYSVAVDGTIAELDPAFGKGGYDLSGSYYLDSADEVRTPYLFDHTIGSGNQGDAIIPPPLGTSEQSDAWLTVRTASERPVTAVALAHKSNDGNMVRWRGVRIEASADGETWELLRTLPADFDSVHDLRQKTLFILQVDPDNSYRYVRLSKSGSAISIGSMDVYVAAPAVTVPDNVLNGWEGDPYLGPKAPAASTEPEPGTTARPEEITADIPAEPAPETTATPAEHASGGCGSMLSGSGAVLLLAAAGLSGCWGCSRKSRKR